MEQSFDSREFCESLGQRLVRAFDDAGAATTPGLVGAARETAVRRELEAALPGGLAVGTGCVIDSYGSTSQQQDIIIYERDLCPVFSVADAADAGYYPCEGVVAVGEVKSKLDGSEMRNIFGKVESVKGLVRRAEPESSGLVSGATVPYRSYGSPTAMHGIASEQFDQVHNEQDQIYGFGVAGESRLAGKTLISQFVELVCATDPHKVPESLTVLDTGVLRFAMGERLVRGVGSADSVALTAPTSPFRHLLSALVLASQRGRTVSRGQLIRYYTEPGAAVPVVNRKSLSSE